MLIVTDRGDGMKRAGRVFASIGIVLLVLVLLLAGVGAWFVRRPWTRVNGVQAVAGR